MPSTTQNLLSVLLRSGGPNFPEDPIFHKFLLTVWDHTSPDYCGTPRRLSTPLVPVLSPSRWVKLRPVVSPRPYNPCSDKGVSYCHLSIQCTVLPNVIVVLIWGSSFCFTSSPLVPSSPSPHTGPCTEPFPSTNVSLPTLYGSQVGTVHLRPESLRSD